MPSARRCATPGMSQCLPRDPCGGAPRRLGPHRMRRRPRGDRGGRAKPTDVVDPRSNARSESAKSTAGRTVTRVEQRGAHRGARVACEDERTAVAARREGSRAVGAIGREAPRGQSRRAATRATAASLDCPAGRLPSVALRSGASRRRFAAALEVREPSEGVTCRARAMRGDDVACRRGVARSRGQTQSKAHAHSIPNGLGHGLRERGNDAPASVT